MKEYVIGVDIGGTKIATGMVSIAGKVKKKIVLPTLAQKGKEASLEQVYSSIHEIFRISKVPKGQIEGIGLCAPGPLDPKRGIVHNPPNLQGWKDVPLAELVTRKFNKKTRLENDANAAGMAEAIWGAAKKYKDIFYVTVSTGIGTAIIIDKKIYHGKNGMAGEGGHITIDYKSKYVCNCGNIGCIETLASGPNTVKQLREKLEKNPGIKTSLTDMADGDLGKLTMAIVGDAAREGDKVALDMIEEQGTLIGIWLGGMVSLLDPEVIVIGGGVSLLGEMLLKHIRKSMPRRTINIFAKKTPVVQARLKRDVGIVGAASVLLEGKET